MAVLYIKHAILRCPVSIFHKVGSEQFHVTCLFVYSLSPRAREARTRGRVIGVSGCLFVCLFVCLWTQKRATGQFMSSTYYVPVRNRKILACTYMYLTNESVRQGAKKSRLFRSIETTI